MAEEKFKRIIFCQGDKKELEEITGHRYEYLKPSKIEELPSSWGQPIKPEYNSTFVQYGAKTRNNTAIRNMFHGIASDLDADAFIHYQEMHSEETISASEGPHHFIRARGTPVRKK